MDAKKSTDILRVLYFQEPYKDILTKEDYLVLRANQLSGSLYPMIKEQNHLYKGFKEDYYRYIQRDEIQRQLLDDLRRVFNENQIDFVFLKGSFLKNLYPFSFMRAMGDIDLLIRGEEMDHVHDVLEKNGYHNWNNSTNHDCFMKSGINVEVHPKLDSEISDDYKDLFMTAWLYAEHKEKHEYELQIEYRFFYQLYHMIKHLYHSGVGLRTFIDLQLILEGIDKSSQRYVKIYNQFPKKKFVNFIRSILEQMFTKNTLSNDSNYDKINLIKTNKFINYIIQSGTHGIGEQHNLFIGGMASSHHKKEWVVWTKIKFLLSKTFLSFNQMKGLYSYLNKYPILLPFAYLQRIFKLLFKKSARQKLTRLQAKKEEIEFVEELFIDIGIK